MKIFSTVSGGCSGQAGLDAAQAQKPVEGTHRVCPCSNAARGNTGVRLHIGTDQI